MAPYKVPTVVEFVEEIPRSASGKALRRLLREGQSEQVG
jgi:acyl-coenzyme A synthetase/AMP-(fatty) acid ligase